MYYRNMVANSFLEFDFSLLDFISKFYDNLLAFLMFNLIV